MNLLIRILKFFQSEAHALVSRFEDPVKLIEQGIRDLKKDFDDSMKSVAQIKAIAIGTKKERGITITSAATYCEWRGHELNLIDTPGHVDFTVEVERSLRVLDGAVTVLDAQNGVEPQTETVWRQASEYKVPRIVYVNKMDKVGADFEGSVKSLMDRLGANGVAIQYPIGSENDFQGIIDLVDMKAYYYSGDEKETAVVKEIPADLVSKANEYRTKMLEEIVAFDDACMEKYLGGEELTIDEIKQCIRKGTLTSEFFPVICGSSFKNKGVSKMMDAVVDYLPRANFCP